MTRTSCTIKKSSTMTNNSRFSILLHRAICPYSEIISALMNDTYVLCEYSSREFSLSTENKCIIYLYLNISNELFRHFVPFILYNFKTKHQKNNPYYLSERLVRSGKLYLTARLFIFSTTAQPKNILLCSSCLL